MGDAIKLIGTGVNTNHTYQPILNAEQLEQLESTPEKNPLMVIPSIFGSV
jgi:hypothetical protein